MVEDRRRRYEDLRLRLLPVLEVAEAGRVERLQVAARPSTTAVDPEGTAARSEGMTVGAHRRRATREQRERERLWGGEVPDPGWAQAWIIGSVVTVPITGVVGLILVVALLLTGRSPLAAVVGAVLGGLAGWILASGVFFGILSLVGRPGPHSWIVARTADPALTLTLLGIFVVPSVLAVLVALWLASAMP